MKLVWGLLLVMTLTIPWSTAHADTVLRIATEGAYPPFNDIDKNGKLVGFDVEIALALCKAMKRDCSIEAIEWVKLLQALEEKKIDAIVASMARTPERENHARFTTAYYRSRGAFVGDPSKQFVMTAEGLAGMKIATQEGTVQEGYLRSNFGEQAVIITTTTTSEAFDMLAANKVDAVLSDSLHIFDFLQTDAGQRFDFVGVPLPASDPSSEACIAVHKDDEKLEAAFEEALKEIRLSGVYDKINRKYFPFSVY